MTYLGRPGPSPVLAALVAAGTLPRSARVLDLGCGNGTDAVALARWGFRGVVGVDTDRRALGVARRRARSLGVQGQVSFREGDALHLPDVFEARSFDAVVDTLVFNNLGATDEETAAYAEGVAHVLGRGGLFLCQPRILKRDERDPWPMPRVFERYFTFGPVVSTFIPERHPDGLPEQARISVHVGRRNRTRVRRTAGE